MRPNVRTYLVDDRGERVFGPGPAELLRRVREHGSLRAAAISMGMAYTKALALIRNAEAALGHPLTQRVIGGVGGGGSTPTPEADALLAAYDAWTASVRATSGAQYAAAFASIEELGRYANVKPAEGAENRVVGVGILAAGRAERFGANKLMEPLLGENVLERSLGCIVPGMQLVLATNNAEVEDYIKRSRGIEIVRPAGPDQGDSVAALAAYAKRAGWSAIMFINGDQPLVEQASTRAMLALSANKPDAVVRLSWRGLHASPAIFPATTFDALCAAKGDKGGSQILGENIETLSVEATWPWELWDVDTPDELARVRQIMEAGLGRASGA